MKIDKKIKLVLIAVFFALILVAKNSYATEGTVTGSSVRMRKENNTTSEVITNLVKDDKVEVLSEDGDWYKIKYDNQEGYIHKDYLKVEEQTTEDQNQQNEEENKQNEEENNQEKVLGNKINKDSKLYILPSYSTADDTQIKKDTEIKILRTINNWTNIEYQNNTYWIPNEILLVTQATEPETTTETEENSGEENPENKPEEKPEEVSENTSANDEENKQINKKGYIIACSANLREKPTTKSDVMGGLAQNEIITVISEENGWYKIETSDGLSGYVLATLVKLGEPPVSSRSLDEARTSNTNEVTNSQKEEVKEEKVNTSTSSTKGEEIVAFAKKYLGYKYVSGGKTPTSGFDCSGFTSYVYGNFGISISSSSSSQSNYGTKVDKQNLKPGDLLLFYNDGKSRIGHVGIYIGNNEFIHASNPSDGVKITSLSLGYYAERYVGARRLVD